MKNIVFKLVSAFLAVMLLLSAAPLSGFVGLNLPAIDISPYAGAEILPGDVDNDGYVSSRDARMALRHSLKYDTLTSVQITAADVDNYDNVTTADARLIMRLAVGLEGNSPKLTDAVAGITRYTHETSYASLVMSSEDDIVCVAVKLNNCVGLTAADMVLSYNSEKLEYSTSEEGQDFIQVDKTKSNDILHTQNANAGKLYFSMSFRQKLWTKEEFAADAKVYQSVNVNDEAFEVIIFCFTLKDNAVVTKDDVKLETAVAEFSGSSLYYDLSIVPPYISVDMRPDYSEKLLYATVVFNNCVGLQSCDASFLYNTERLEFDCSRLGDDAEQVRATQNNSFSDMPIDKGCGVLDYSMFFLDSLWTSEQFAADAPEQNIYIDDASFESSVFIFKIKGNTAVDITDITLTDAASQISGSNVNLKNSLTIVKLACQHKGGVATCKKRAVCDICKEEYGKLGEHDIDIKTCVYDGICSVCGKRGEEFAPHRGGIATCTEYALCEVCGQPYGELAEHSGGTATASSLAVCKICGEAYGNYLPESPVDLRGEVRDNKCFVRIYLHDAVGFTDGDLVISCKNQNLSVLGFYLGKDTELLSGKNEYTSIANTDNLQNIIFAANFREHLLDTASYKTQPTLSSTDINGEDFEANVLVFDFDINKVTAGDVLTFTLTGTCHKTSSAAAVSCNDTLTLSVPEHKCHSGRATCQTLAECAVCGNKYGKYALHVDGNGDCKCDICSEFVSDFEYTVLSDGTAEITGYNGNKTIVAIPHEINEKTVTSISDTTFTVDNGGGLTAVTIPASVSTIKETFEGLSGIKEINIDSGNRKYKSVDGVLFTKDMQKLVRYPEGKTDTSYTVPDSVNSIESRAFMGCGILRAIKFPNSVKSIGVWAFGNCTNLNEITLPTDYCEIGSIAFENTGYYNNGANWKNDLLYIGNYLIAYGWSDDADVVNIADGVRVIANGIFSSIDPLYIGKVTLPDSIYYIGEAALALQYVTEIKIPKNVAYIGDNAIGYHVDSKGFYEKTDEFVMNGYAGSVAEKYANANGIKFTVIQEHTHSYTSKVTVSPTCVKPGVKTFTCSCGKSYTENIKATGHIPGAWTVIKNASYTENGIRVKKCTVCSAELSRETIPMLIRETIMPVAVADKTVKIESDKTVTGIRDKTTVADAVKLFEDSSRIKVTDAKGKTIASDDSEAIIGTGYKISMLSEDGKTTDTVEVIIMGDADSDGKATAADARLCLRQSVGLEKFTGVFHAACNIDGGNVASSDGRLILRYAVGLEKAL